MRVIIMLHANMKSTVALLISNSVFLIIGLILTPPEDRAFFGPIVAPFIILYMVFAYFCLKEKKWSYTGSLVLSIIAIVLFFVIAFPGLMMPEEDQGPPAVFIALLMILPVLLAVKSYEALDSFTK